MPQRTENVKDDQAKRFALAIAGGPVSPVVVSSVETEAMRVDVLRFHECLFMASYADKRLVGFGPLEYGDRTWPNVGEALLASLSEEDRASLERTLLEARA